MKVDIIGRIRFWRATGSHFHGNEYACNMTFPCKKLGWVWMDSTDSCGTASKTSHIY